MPDSTCFNEFQIYPVCVIGSIIFIVALSIFARTQDNFSADPQRGTKIYFICGMLKVIIGALLTTILYPVDCPVYVNVYGMATVTFGVYWIVKGNLMGNTAASSAQPGDGSEMTAPRGDYVKRNRCMRMLVSLC